MALWPRTPAYYARNSWAGKLIIDGRPVYDSPFNNALAHQIMNMLYLASPEPDRAAYPADVQAELYRAYPSRALTRAACACAPTRTSRSCLWPATLARTTSILFCSSKPKRPRRSLAWTAARAITYADGTEEPIEWGDFRLDMFHNVLQAVRGEIPAPVCTLEVGRAHVACIEALHRVAAIQDVPGEYVSEGEDGQRIIAGVEEAVQAGSGYRTSSFPN